MPKQVRDLDKPLGRREVFLKEGNLLRRCLQIVIRGRHIVGNFFFGLHRFEAGYCPFRFEMPTYATVERDTLFFEKRPESDCWFNLAIAPLNAKIHYSYYPITSRARFDELVGDAFTMTQKHNIKASYIEEVPIHRPADRVHGLIFEVEGPAASAYQFFLTDSTRHFLRGALYFNTQARPDSLAPVIEFVRQDLNRMVQTLTWK